MTRIHTRFSFLLRCSVLMLIGLLAFQPVYAQDTDQSGPVAETVEKTVADRIDVEDAEPKKDRQAEFNAWFAKNINDRMGKVLFAPVPFLWTYKVTEDGEPVLDAHGDQERNSIPVIVLVLVLGGIFFTFRYGFINIRLFGHAIQVIRGKYDKKDDEGEITHFQALTSALSATVGLGNIAGVAIAISLGGPGAVFWMWTTAFFGMTMKFNSCTLAHLYRRVGKDGHVQGGPMIYLEEGLKDVNPALAPIGKLFAVVFAVFMVLAAFGAGNLFQANQTASIITMLFFDGNESVAVQLTIGVVMAFLAGIVLIGGIKRIGDITAKVVPAMCLFYCTVCLIIILMNIGEIGPMFGSIFSNAFNAPAMFGGFVGVLVQGMKRAAFSNEAGLGSAAIAHAAAKTDEPVREGLVAMVGPFIDTLVVCTMTALTILITKSHLDTDGLEGVQITARAFSELGGAVPFILCLAVFVFAYSTIISWGYYAERCVEYLFGLQAIMFFRLVYVFVIIIAPVLSLGAVVDFADILLLTLAFPNIIGSALITIKVKPLLEDYIKRLRSGEMKMQD